MSYERTPEIRSKQSQKMKKKVLEYDWDQIDEKRKETLPRNNKKVGRKKGEGSARSGVEKQCIVCNNSFYVIQSRIETAKCCSRECMYQDPAYIEKLKRADRSYMQGEKYALATRDPNTPKYKQYQRDVFRMTEETYAAHIELINPNRYPRTLAGVEGGYQLDHKISVRHGFDNDIDPRVIASANNLQMLPWKDNIKKGK